MNAAWWMKPRSISVVVDSPNWVMPYAEDFVRELVKGGDDARLCRDHAEVGRDGVAFYLGCEKITPPDVLARNHRNLVVHASDLPRGRGFSPLTWLTLEGKTDIPICLFEAVTELDAGAVVYRDVLPLGGHELIDEMRAGLGPKQIELCRRFLANEGPKAGVAQMGEPTYYGRRRPSDSRLDPHKSIVEQFDLLRVVDNESYPAFFEHRGHTYKLAIQKFEPGKK